MYDVYDDMSEPRRSSIASILEEERAQRAKEIELEREEEEYRFNPFMPVGTEYRDRRGVLRVQCGLGEDDNPTVAEFNRAQATKKSAIDGVHSKLIRKLLDGIVDYKMGGREE